MNIDLHSTNEKLAELLQQQTYDERMEMAEWFRDTMADLMADLKEWEFIQADAVASLLSNWAEYELEAETEPTP